MLRKLNRLDFVIDKIISMGALRNMLHGLAIALILILPFSEPSWNPHGSAIFLGAAVPAIAPIVFVILMLDTLMCKVFQSDTEDQALKKHYSTILKTHFGIAALLLLIWIHALQTA